MMQAARAWSYALVSVQVVSTCRAKSPPRLHRSASPTSLLQFKKYQQQQPDPTHVDARWDKITSLSSDPSYGPSAMASIAAPVVQQKSECGDLILLLVPLADTERIPLRKS